MAFVLSKTIWPLLQPSNLLLVLLVVGAVLSRRRRWARRLVSVVVLFFALAAFVPLGQIFARPLEKRFPQPAALPAAIDGIIVLGGSFRIEITEEYGQPALNHHAERLTEFAQLARRYPDARLVFTGGSASLFPEALNEAEIARRVFAQMGLDLSRVTFEDRSRNTRENAVLTEAMVRPEPGEIWLLITSAQHMPRAVGVFRHVNWPVTPYPVDYQVSRLRLSFSLGASLSELDGATREWIGLLAYRLFGWTPTLFPGP